MDLQHVFLGSVLLLWSYMESIQSITIKESRTKRDTEKVIFGRALSWDWDFRDGNEPPLKEVIDIKYDRQNTESKRLIFQAFGKKWKINVRKNTMLLSDKTTFDFRTVAGRILKSTKGPRDCFYIGLADASNHEAGLAAVTTCTGALRALIITNLNDYVILPTSGTLTKRRLTRSASDDVKHTMEVADLTDFENYLSKKGFDIPKTNNRQRFRRGNADYADVILAPLPPPTGRAVYVEIAAIFDQYYIDDFKETMSHRKEDIYLHAAEVFNFAQLWFIHPTFGFQVWLTLRNAIFVEDDITLGFERDTKSYPASVCKWQQNNFTDSENWDEVFVFSSKEGIWHGRVGMAQRSGVCERKGRDKCAGVSHMNFQMATLARLVAHEGSHPLGMTDDYEGSTSKLCFTGLMRRGVWQDHDWSKCSVQHFQRWLEVTSTKCIQRDQTPSLSSSTKPPILPVNIAWRAAVVQSSTYENEARWGAWKATDGEIAGVPENNPILGSCTHTLSQKDPWIRVELEDRYSSTNVDYVYIYNRPDCCSNRLRDFEVRIGNDRNHLRNPLCNTHEGAVPGGRFGMAIVRCQRTLRGKYVSVQIKGERSILTVCEIQVFQSIYLDDFSDISEHTCLDHHGFCAFWAGSGACEKKSQQPYMHRTCPHSCGLCDRPDIRQPSLRRLSPTYAPTEEPDTECVDTHPSCYHVVANEECHKKRLYKTMCKKSCGFCKKLELYKGAAADIKKHNEEQRNNDIAHLSNDRRRTRPTQRQSSHNAQGINTENVTKTEDIRPCRDRTHGCSINVRQGQCEWHRVTRERCAESCGLCGAKKQSAIARTKHVNCFDIHGSCQAWFKAGYCTWNAVVKDFCPRTCDVCEEQQRLIGRGAPRRKDDYFVCKDKHYKCKIWARKGFCVHNRYTKNRCMKSCHICE